MKISDELFRKILHFILLGSAIVLLNIFTTWHGAAIAPLIFAVLVYPLLSLEEKFKNYSQILVERDSGEIKKKSLIRICYVLHSYRHKLGNHW
jgi:phytol kinase